MKSPIIIKLHEPTFSEEEIAAAVEVLRSTQVTSGKKVREFEKAFSNDHCVMVNSGSSANLLAISALTNPVNKNRLIPGDEVIVSALSWSTTIWPLVQHGLIPVIVDIDPKTLNIDVEQVKQAISPRTKAIMPVHVYGNPCEMTEIMNLCMDHELILVEDCCEALGAEYDSQPVGSFGDIGTFSFYFSHHMTTLEGGLCMTHSKDLEELMRVLRAHGWIRDLDNNEKYKLSNPDIDPKFLFVNAGYNLRATELQAAIGLVQLPKLRGFVEARRKAAHGLKQVFSCYDYLDVQEETDKGESSWFGFPIVVKDGDASSLREHLEKNGVETRAIICGNIARQPGMKLWPHRIPFDLPNADRVMKQGFSIGCHQNIGEEQIVYVDSVMKVFHA